MPVHQQDQRRPYHKGSGSQWRLIKFSDSKNIKQLEPASMTFLETFGLRDCLCPEQMPGRFGGQQNLSFHVLASCGLLRVGSIITIIHHLETDNMVRNIQMYNVQVV